jgi:hypothetical protein
VLSSLRGWREAQAVVGRRYLPGIAVESSPVGGS